MNKKNEIDLSPHSENSKSQLSEVSRPKEKKQTPEQKRIWEKKFLGDRVNVRIKKNDKDGTKIKSRLWHKYKEGWISLSNLPNLLTLLRLALIPLFILLAPWDYRVLNQLAALVFALAAITDFLDGFFARKMGVTSSIGAILDLLADKALLAAAAVVLSARYPLYIPLFSLLIIREVVVMGLRNLSLEKGYTIEAGGAGKAKTAFLSVAVIGLVLGHSNDFPWISIGFICLLIGTLLSLRSAWLYIQEFYQHHFHSHEEK